MMVTKSSMLTWPLPSVSPGMASQPHEAMRLAGFPSAVVKSPPAISLPLNCARQYTHWPLVPLPSADQLEPPVHRAILLAGTPLAAEKNPPTAKSPLGNRLSETTVLFGPVALNEDQVPPLHRAMWGAMLPPALLKTPPTSRLPLGYGSNA